MTLEQLGNIGEFIASLGLLFSIALLVLELRHSRKLAKVNGTEARAQQWLEWRRLLINPEYADVFRRGSTQLDSLSETEFAVYDALMNERMVIILRMFVRSKELGDREEYEQARGNLIDQFRMWPGAVQWWNKRRKSYRTYFREFVDETLDEAKQDT